MLTQRQEDLLKTFITEFGFGDVFNRWFNLTIAGQPLGCDPMTLQEFFMANNRLFDNIERFVCNNKGETGFQRQNPCFGILLGFLRKEGFTHEHWVMLLPGTHVGVGRANLNLLSKFQLSALPFYQVCVFKTKALFFQRLAAGLFQTTVAEVNKKNQNEVRLVPVRVLLTLTQEQLQGILYSREDVMDRPDRRGTLISLQKGRVKLKILGFSEDDGPFMSLSLVDTKPAKVLSEEAIA